MDFAMMIVIQTVAVQDVPDNTASSNILLGDVFNIWTITMNI
jgi:hypothetical protein